MILNRLDEIKQTVLVNGASYEAAPVPAGIKDKKYSAEFMPALTVYFDNMLPPSGFYVLDYNGAKYALTLKYDRTNARLPYTHAAYYAFKGLLHHTVYRRVSREDGSVYEQGALMAFEFLDRSDSYAGGVRRSRAFMADQSLAINDKADIDGLVYTVSGYFNDIDKTVYTAEAQ